VKRGTLIKPMIKELLAELTSEDRQLLMFAFTNEISQLVDLGGGKVLGVYINGVKGIQVIESAGEWCYGQRA